MGGGLVGGGRLAGFRHAAHPATIETRRVTRETLLPAPRHQAVTQGPYLSSLGAEDRAPATGDTAMLTGLNLTLPTWADLLEAAGFVALGNAALRWYRRHRDLRHVTELEDYLLRDVGLTREEVQRAAAEPFWRH